MSSMEGGTICRAVLIWIAAMFCFEHVITFVASTPSSRHPLAPAGGAAGLLRYADASPAMPPAGTVSFEPHNSGEISERAVYDPGDELLRALKAEEAAVVAAMPQDNDYVDNVINDLDLPQKYELFQKLEDDLREEQDIVSKSAILMKLLEDPTVDTLPVVYVEESPAEDSNSNAMYPSAIVKNEIAKRSRYYRRYPWKRHSRNRSTYEPEIRYACTPSKEDVFKLLVGLHENRNGNQHKTVNFCNRKRPAKAIFTNIRFLG